MKSRAGMGLALSTICSRKRKKTFASIRNSRSTQGQGRMAQALEMQNFQPLISTKTTGKTKARRLPARDVT